MIDGRQTNAVQEAQKKLNRGKFYRRTKFGAEVISYKEMVYRVRFSNRGEEFAIEDIPRKHFDDWNPEKEPLPEFWEKLFQRLEEEIRVKGGEPDQP